MHVIELSRRIPVWPHDLAGHLAYRCRTIISETAIERIAENYGLAFDEVRAAMLTLPVELAPLFDHPHGWTELGRRAADIFNLSDLPPLSQATH